MYICVFLCICMCTCVLRCMCRSQKATLLLSLRSHSQCFFETRWVTKTWGPYIRLGWIDNESQGSVCLVPISSALELQMWLPYRPFYMGSGDQNQVLILEQQALYKLVWSPQSPYESVTYISLSVTYISAFLMLLSSKEAFNQSYWCHTLLFWRGNHTWLEY